MKPSSRACISRDLFARHILSQSVPLRPWPALMVTTDCAASFASASFFPFSVALLPNRPTWLADYASDSPCPQLHHPHLLARARPDERRRVGHDGHRLGANLSTAPGLRWVPVAAGGVHRVVFQEGPSFLKKNAHPFSGIGFRRSRFRGKKISRTFGAGSQK